MWNHKTYQPFKVPVEPSQSVHVRPKHQRDGDHFEADVQQLRIAVVSPLYQQTCDKEQVLEMFQQHKNPYIDIRG